MYNEESQDPAPSPAQREDTPATEHAFNAILQCLRDQTGHGVFIGPDRQVLHLTYGASRFLRFNTGQPTPNLLHVITPDLRLDVTTALYDAEAEGRDQTRLATSVRLGGGTRGNVRVTVRPLKEPAAARGCYLVVFDPVVADTETLAASRDITPAGANQDIVRQAEGTAASLQAQLRSTVEQYEAVVEELKVANEEQQAINEERRSVTEELETSREELRTVNRELKNRIDEVSRTNSDLQNLLSSTDIGTVFVGRDLHLMRYTPGARSLFNLIPSDVGRPLSHLAHQLDYSSAALMEDVQRVLRRLTPLEREVRCADGRALLMRLTPYRTLDDRIEGVVLTFPDITELRRAEEALRASEEKYRTLFETMGQGYADIELLRDAEGRAVDQRYIGFNPAFERLIGIPVAEAQGRTAGEVLPDLEPWWHETFDRIVKRGEPERIEHEVASLGRWYEVLAHPHGGDRLSVLYDDITERKRREADTILLDDISKDLALLSTPDEIMEATSTRVGGYLRASSCTLVEVEEERGENTVHHAWSTEGAPSLKRTFRMDEYVSEEFIRAGRAGEAFVVRDAARDQSVNAQNCARLNIGSFVCVPFHWRGRWTSSVCVVSAEPRDWRADEVELLREVANRLFSRLERARAEEALRQSEERLRAFVAASSDAVYRMSPDWVQMRALDGKGFVPTTAQASTSWLETYIPAEDWARVQEVIHASIRAKGPFELEHRVRRADGTLGWTLSRAVPLIDAAGEIVEWFGAAADVTARRRAEEALWEANAALARSNETLEARVAERTAQVEDLLRQLVGVQEAERARLSRELHDQFAQRITGFMLGANALAASQPAGSDAAALAAVLRETAAGLSQEVHQLARDLRPPELDDMGLSAALSTYVREWGERHGIEADFQDGEGGRLPPEVETALYRIAQEALANVARHAAGASRAGVLLGRWADQIQMVVEDDGAGFDVEASAGSGRLGLRGMRERAEMLGGTLEVEAAPGDGTTLFVRIPLDPVVGGIGAGGEADNDGNRGEEGDA